MQPFFQEGTISIIDGAPGTGKTALSLLMAERYLKKVSTGTVLTNIPVKHPRIQHFGTAASLIRALVDTTEGLVILDEAGIYGTSGAGEDKRTRGNLQMMLKLIRKLNLSLIWIDQVFEGSVPPAVRSMSIYLFHKASLRTLEVCQVVGGAPQVLHTVTIDERDLPKMEWNTYGNSSFEMDLPEGMDFSDIFNALARDPWMDNRKALEKFVVHYLDGGHDENANGKRERENLEGETLPDPSVSGAADPSKTVTTRELVFGILQHNPEVKTRTIAKVLKLEERTIRRYRAEFNSKDE